MYHNPLDSRRDNAPRDSQQEHHFVFLLFPLQIQATRPCNSLAPIMAGRAFARGSLRALENPPLRSYASVRGQQRQTYFQLHFRTRKRNLSLNLSAVCAQATTDERVFRRTRPQSLPFRFHRRRCSRDTPTKPRTRERIPRVHGQSLPSWRHLLPSSSNERLIENFMSIINVLFFVFYVSMQSVGRYLNSNGTGLVC